MTMKLVLSVRYAWCGVHERRQTVATIIVARERVACVCFDRFERKREPRACTPPTGCATKTATDETPSDGINW